ncbi:hypothetical protein MTO96_042978, partial [Rhipicephalus appendiculatus]
LGYHVTYSCSRKTFECVGDGKLVDRTRLCDGVWDCWGGSDETDCHSNRTCLETEFRCERDGRCIPVAWRCDSFRDCEDGTDETDDMCQHNVTCDAGEVPCGPVYFGKKICHATPRCGDEYYCTDPHKNAVYVSTDACPPGQFSCQTTIEGPMACLKWTFRCDGQRQCIDGYDESDCEKRVCDDEEFRCPGSAGRCVSKRYICDGKRDCQDGRDESEELCFLYKHCPRGQLACLSHNDSIICVDEARRCEEPAECKNGSQESRLCFDLALHCLVSFFRCANGLCVPKSWRCNTYNDCLDDIATRRSAPPATAKDA